MMTDSTQIELADMAIVPVDPDSPVPLYHQVEEDLRRLMREGNLPDGALLPPEIALSKAYHVGRHTMRMALSRLATDGLIARRAGRGTIVKRPPDRAKFLLDCSFTRQMAEMGRVARTKVLTLRSGHIGLSSPIVFVEHMGAPCLQLERLRFGDDEPVGIQHSTILTQQCPDLAEQDFNRYGLYDILAREYRLTVTTIQHTITAAAADARQAQHLQLAPGDPLVVVNTTTFLDDNDLFEFTTSYYRADRYEYSTTRTYSA